MQVGCKCSSSGVQVGCKYSSSGSAACGARYRHACPRAHQTRLLACASCLEILEVFPSEGARGLQLGGSPLHHIERVDQALLVGSGSRGDGSRGSGSRGAPGLGNSVGPWIVCHTGPLQSAEAAPLRAKLVAAPRSALGARSSRPTRCPRLAELADAWRHRGWSLKDFFMDPRRVAGRNQRGTAQHAKRGHSTQSVGVESCQSVYSHFTIVRALPAKKLDMLRTATEAADFTDQDLLQLKRGRAVCGSTAGDNRQPAA